MFQAICSDSIMAIITYTFQHLFLKIPDIIYLQMLALFFKVDHIILVIRINIYFLGMFQVFKKMLVTCHKFDQITIWMMMRSWFVYILREHNHLFFIIRNIFSGIFGFYREGNLNTFHFLYIFTIINIFARTLTSNSTFIVK